MAMTKPAGVALQILSIPFLFYGIAGFSGDPLGIVLGLIGLLMLWLGGRPAMAAIKKRDES